MSSREPAEHAALAAVKSGAAPRARPYNDVTAYVIGLAALALLATDARFRADLWRALLHPIGDDFGSAAFWLVCSWTFVGISLLGCVEAVVRPLRLLPWAVSANARLGLIINANLVFGIVAAFQAYDEAVGWWLALPIVNGLLVLHKTAEMSFPRNPNKASDPRGRTLGAKPLDAKVNMDFRRMKPFHVAAATGIVIVLLACREWLADLSWAQAGCLACLAAEAASQSLAALVPLDASRSASGVELPRPD
jgi:hypothetical protein